MKKILLANTIILSILVIVLTSLVIGLLIPRGGNLGAPQYVANQGGQQGQQAGPQGQLPDKKPSEYKIGISYDKAIKADKPFAALFYADWCPHCRAFAPMYKDLADRYSDKYNFVMVNAEDKKNADLLREFQISAFPTLYLVNPKTGDHKYIKNELFASMGTLGGELDKYLKTVK